MMMIMIKPARRFTLILAALFLAACSFKTQQPAQTVNSAAGSQLEDLATYIREHYAKQEVQIPMRDGVKLFTAIYSPRDASQRYPIMLIRTPYSVDPYGPDAYRTSLGPSEAFAREGFIFAYQDVRGCHKSEGEFINMTPHIPVKVSSSDIDESTDTYDSIQWLLDNLPNDNGRVGQWGISYPGFYVAAGMIDAHPALQAVSPQAPIADWYFDDFHHHGAFFLPHSFNFLAGFGRARAKPGAEPSAEEQPRFEHGTPDGYQFFLDLGSLRNVEEKYFKGQIAFWTELAAHPDYDAFWQARNILPHLKNVAPAVMTVGGWFDAEDLYGPLQIYRSIESKNPGIFNILVMGPWVHGGWARTDGDSLGIASFGGKQSLHYRQNIELPFFNYYLKNKGAHDLPEAAIFETGANRWRTFNQWPPADTEAQSLYLRGNGTLSFVDPIAVAYADETDPDDEDDAQAGPQRSAGPGQVTAEPQPPVLFDQFISDPTKPVPYTEAIAISMTQQYMTDDQRFAARRPDVLVYQTEVLEEDLTIAGPIAAELWVSTSAGDADWIVKLIDVFPPDAPDHEHMPPGKRLAGAHMMVRSDAFRGRYRNSYTHPEPFEPDVPTLVEVPLQDVLHTFRKGHRIMVQIQSTWFPLVDRNPQKYVRNIFQAAETDFTKATHRVYRSPDFPTRLRINLLPQGAERQNHRGAEAQSSTGETVIR